MSSRQSFMAIEALMRECSNNKYDSGEDGLFEDCRSCRFHRPYSSVQTCLFSVCPYSDQQASTRKLPQRFRLAYVSKQ